MIEQTGAQRAIRQECQRGNERQECEIVLRQNAEPNRSAGQRVIHRSGRLQCADEEIAKHAGGEEHGHGVREVALRLVADLRDGDQRKRGDHRKHAVAEDAMRRQPEQKIAQEEHQVLEQRHSEYAAAQ